VIGAAVSQIWREVLSGRKFSSECSLQEDRGGHRVRTWRRRREINGAGGRGTDDMIAS
jgi:hypothetical protein